MPSHTDRDKLPLSRILCFEALEWFEKDKGNLLPIEIDWSGEDFDFSENGELIEQTCTDHKSTFDAWMAWVDAYIRRYSGYRIKDFILRESEIIHSGPMGRLENRHCHRVHSVIIVLERGV